MQPAWRDTFRQPDLRNESTIGYALPMSIPFRIRRHPRARRLKLRVRRDESVEVVAPPGVGERRIRAFVESNGDWVDNARRRVRAERRDGPENDPFPAVLALRAIGQRIGVGVDGGERPGWSWRPDGLAVELPERDAAVARTTLIGALKARARQVLEPWLLELAARHDLPVGRVSWRNQKSRWGSCSSRGNISLNVRLLFVPPEPVEYVFVHELAHLQHPDHSPRFWLAVEAMRPGYDRDRRAIRRAGRFVPDWIR